MEALPYVLRFLGVIVYIAGWFPTIREMFFQDNRGLGYLSFMAPILTVVYAGIHFDELKQAFWLQVAGIVLIVAGWLLPT